MYSEKTKEKLKTVFPQMLVFKDPQRNKSISSWGIPGFLRDWLVKRFAREDGTLDIEAVQSYVKEHIPSRGDWEKLKKRMTTDFATVKILAKVRAELDVATGEGLFSLPDFGFPSRKYDAIIDKSLLREKGELILSSSENWGVIELEWRLYAPEGKKEKGVIFMTSFTPFRPYRVDLTFFQLARKEFTLAEWLDVILSAIDYNPQGFLDTRQKLTFISRLIPFVEKRANIIELAPKGTGKSYVFSEISKYGWLVSGGSVTRAKLFYDIQRRQPGIICRQDYVALDEIQSISFPDEEEIRGALKGYLESGEFRVGDYRGVGEAGFVLLGNINYKLTSTSRNMFTELPSIFHESALLDRFHGFIRGWDIPRMKENMKASGWALSAEYFSEIMHCLREDIRYRDIVDEMLAYPKSADTRDTEAIKRLTTALMKLLMPHIVIDKTNIDKEMDLIAKYCLKPAIVMRKIIRKQLHIMDREYDDKVPEIKLKGKIHNSR